MAPVHMDFSWHDAQSVRLAGADRRDDVAEESYRMLQANRMRIGLSRLSIGFHLAQLKDSGAWRGRTGSLSFHRFMIEEGLEPKSAVQYIAVARAYLITHNIEPRRIAMASMRLLTACIPRLNAENVQEVVDLLGSLPAAEARQAIEERFPLPEEALVACAGRPVLSKSANRILGELDGMSFDERRDLYRVLHLAAGPLESALPSSIATGQASEAVQVRAPRQRMAANDVPPPLSISA